MRLMEAGVGADRQPAPVPQQLYHSTLMDYALAILEQDHLLAYQEEEDGHSGACLTTQFDVAAGYGDSRAADISIADYRKHYRKIPKGTPRGVVFEFDGTKLEDHFTVQSLGDDEGEWRVHGPISPVEPYLTAIYIDRKTFDWYWEMYGTAKTPEDDHTHALERLRWSHLFRYRP